MPTDPTPSVPAPPPPAARLSHVGIAVRVVADALPLYRDILGLPVVPLDDADGAAIVGLRAGEPLIELLEAQHAASPVARFVASRGPGIHHLCFAIADLDAALARCRAAGLRLIDDTPRPGAEGKRIAFIHPSATGGVLIELTEE
jgi:methylmalonyl-CoA/ethylmalonyl-CoA epimerase